jgi:TonB family protein
MRRAQHLMIAGLAGCGGATKPAPVDPGPPVDLPVADAGPDAGSDNDDLEIVSTVGKFDPDEATARFAPHVAALDACYTDQLARRRWLGGTVELTWAVTADGVLEHVRLTRSDLGAWPIERCLLQVAQAVSFGKPHGHGKAEVTFPVSFAGGSAALAWDEDQALRAVGGKAKELAACARPGGGDPANVTVTIYVGTRGKVQSVGFAAPTPLPPAWADCAAGKIGAWMLTDPRGKVAKLAYLYHPVATDDLDSED